MYKHWDFHISMNINCLGTILDLFWAVWKEIFWCLKAKHWLWQFLRYWQFNKQYYSSYLLICLISQPLFISLRHDWYQLKGLFKGFQVSLRLWESSKNWWRYDQMKFMIPSYIAIDIGPVKSITTSSILSYFVELCLGKGSQYNFPWV